MPSPSWMTGPAQPADSQGSPSGSGLTPSWMRQSAGGATSALPTAEQAQTQVYGSPTPARTAPAEEAAQLLAKIQAIPDPKARNKALSAAGANKLYGAISPELQKKYGLQAPKSASSGGIFGKIGRAVTSVPGVKTALNVLGRGEQTVAQVVRDTQKNVTGQHVGPGELLGDIKDSVTGAFDVGGSKQNERVDPTNILHNSDTYQAHGKGDAAINFLGNVALDPATYLTFGATAAAKQGLRALAEGGLEESALKAIGEQGVAKAVEGGLVSRESIESVLREQALTNGSKDVEKAVAKQMAGLEKSAEGGARLAGQKIPGSSLLTKATVGPKVTLAERLGGTALEPVGDALTGAAERVGDVFKPRAGVSREFGAATADRLGELQHGSRSLTEGGLTDVEQQLGSTLKGATPEQLGDLENLRPKSAEDIGRVAQQTQTVAGKYGIKIPTIDAANPAEAAFKTAQHVYKQAGQASLAAAMADPARGLVDDLGRRLAKSVDDVLGTEAPTLFDAGLSTGDRVAAATAKAAKEGLAPIGAGNAVSFVPKGIADEVGKFSATITSDEGVRTLRDGYKSLLRQWKTMATVLPVSPAFSGRNAYSNLFLMAGNGFTHPEVFGDAWKVSRALAKGTVDELPEGLRDIAKGVESVHITDAGQAARELGMGAKDTSKLVTEGDNLGRRSVLKKGYNKAIDFGGDANKAIEDHARVSMYMDGIKKGMTPRDAAARVEKALFNYSDVTKAEGAIKDIIPFYTFMRKNLGQQADLLAHKPGFLTSQIHAGDAVAEAFADPKTGELPDWAVMAGYQPVGGSMFNVDTPLNSAAANIAPLLDLAKIAPGGDKPDLGNIGRSLLGVTGGPGVGFGKALAEEGTGKSLFSGGDIKGGLANPFVGNLVPAAGRVDQTVARLQALPDLGHGDLRPALGLLGVSSKDINAGSDGALLGRVLNGQDGTKDTSLPRLDALRNAGLIPPKEPAALDTRGMTPPQAAKAKQAHIRATIKYKQDLAAFHAHQASGVLTPKQRSLLTALSAGPTG